ncbi:hypothetical protein [Inquilinus sp. Marseille-Q2685]|uniref:hypothetical protein n=1 Tax=Inquilinus sp. Marseille-Q2685 TaxID=2866581 RepID=UPI001CE44430|nr:hypothetical protein [Inquilinus sp. Marseille-Q2685]
MRRPWLSSIETDDDMLMQSWRARRAIKNNFAKVGYFPDAEGWREIKLGIERDLQARRLRPNVRVPPRRDLLRYLSTLRRETGSLIKALDAALYAGSWTSSGGSFRLADMIGLDLAALVGAWLRVNGSVRFLEVGGGWAGFRSRPGRDALIDDIAGLASAHPRSLDRSLHLHFTNLTRWHNDLPAGVREHPFVTAAGILAVEQDGVPRGNVDIIYSQAAAYFERDAQAFLCGAATLLRPAGLLVFNHREEIADDVLRASRACGLDLQSHRDLGGMNGRVACLVKGAALSKTAMTVQADDGEASSGPDHRRLKIRARR